MAKYSVFVVMFLCVAGIVLVPVIANNYPSAVAAPPVQDSQGTLGSNSVKPPEDAGRGVQVVAIIVSAFTIVCTVLFGVRGLVRRLSYRGSR